MYSAWTDWPVNFKWIILDSIEYVFVESSLLNLYYIVNKKWQQQDIINRLGKAENAIYDNSSVVGTDLKKSTWSEYNVWNLEGKIIWEAARTSKVLDRLGTEIRSPVSEGL